jgi:hypothetical protein
MAASSSALGGTSQLQQGQAGAIWSNPALVCGPLDYGLEFDHVYGVDLSNADFLSGRARLGKSLALGVGYYYSGDTDTRRDQEGNNIGSISASDQTLDVALAMHIRNLDLGAAVKGTYEQVDGAAGEGCLFDVGANSRWWGDRLILGVALQNLGEAAKIGNEPQMATPLLLRVQGTESFSSLRFVQELRALTPFGGEQAQNGNDAQVGLGAQYSLDLGSVGIALRGGWDSAEAEAEALSGLGVGFGVNISGFQLDYAFQPLGQLGQAHRVDLAWSFGQETGAEEAGQELKSGEPQEEPKPNKGKKRKPAAEDEEGQTGEAGKTSTAVQAPQKAKEAPVADQGSEEGQEQAGVRVELELKSGKTLKGLVTKMERSVLHIVDKRGKHWRVKLRAIRGIYDANDNELSLQALKKRVAKAQKD